MAAPWFIRNLCNRQLDLVFNKLRHFTHHNWVEEPNVQFRNKDANVFISLIFSVFNVLWEVFLSQEPSDIQHLYAQVPDFTDILASE